jgi:hypothetical protein
MIQIISTTILNKKIMRLISPAIKAGSSGFQFQSAFNKDASGIFFLKIKTGSVNDLVGSFKIKSSNP